MKKLFFALVLLLSAAVDASVNVEVTSRFDADSVTNSATLDTQNASVTVAHENGLESTVSLKEEAPEHATFSVAVSMKNEEEVRELSTSDVTAEYGKAVSVACPQEHVDAELTIVANQMSVAK